MVKDNWSFSASTTSTTTSEVQLKVHNNEREFQQLQQQQIPQFGFDYPIDKSTNIQTNSQQSVWKDFTSMEHFINIHIC